MIYCGIDVSISAVLYISGPLRVCVTDNGNLAFVYAPCCGVKKCRQWTLTEADLLQWHHSSLQWWLQLGSAAQKIHKELCQVARVQKIILADSHQKDAKRYKHKAQVVGCMHCGGSQPLPCTSKILLPFESALHMALIVHPDSHTQPQIALTEL